MSDAWPLAACGQGIDSRRLDNVSELCPLCGNQPDTVHHRLWTCNHPEVRALRDKLVGLTIRNTAKTAPPWSLIFTRGLMPHPEDFMRRPSEVMDVKAVDPKGCTISVDNAFTITGDVFWDGSCDRHALKCLNRAAWAVVALDPLQNIPAVTITGLVPNSLYQTPQAAEFVGYAVGAELASGAVKLHGDCASVTDAAALPLLSTKRTYAAILQHAATRKHNSIIDEHPPNSY